MPQLCIKTNKNDSFSGGKKSWSESQAEAAQTTFIADSSETLLACLISAFLTWKFFCWFWMQSLASASFTLREKKTEAKE